MSPIKDPSAYPKDWKEIVKEIRKRSGGRCECTGQCGLHTATIKNKRCEEVDGQPAKYAKGRIILTVAHLCHESGCRDTKHMIHACNRCHLRIDRDQHRINASHTRAEKKAGKTLSLFT